MLLLLLLQLLLLTLISHFMLWTAQTHINEIPPSSCLLACIIFTIIKNIYIRKEKYSQSVEMEQREEEEGK